MSKYKIGDSVKWLDDVGKILKVSDDGHYLEYLVDFGHSVRWCFENCLNILTSKDK